MNWKMIAQLSLFGLAMGVGTVFVISSDIEPVFWFTVFLICAYVIATRAPGKYFLHGVALGLANSVWVTGAHVLLFDRYIANHPREAAMMSSMPLPNSPRLMMAMVGPCVGLVSGVVIGVLCMIAARILRRSVPA
jgi:hypothetical protein